MNAYRSGPGSFGVLSNFFDRNHMETIWMGAPKRHMHLAAPHVDGASRVAVAARAWWGSRSRD